ncbi:DUF397 domain-containing protein [Embleya scabrispora]|uniref:DUF397 domain-containing protein n=1 Tax=Embleya scabrispora TaxID=159449 RepID=A0A1T3NWG6_9ACTN|nr:DUF397 domain-containing protein [Embleya scabrispora]OPC81012.1 DUF397 domain-containing protein [Embleya scabrispora]
MITKATTPPSRWRKSSYSSNNGGNCVEVATALATIPVRDSKTPNLGHITITPASWSALLTTLHHTS